MTNRKPPKTIKTKDFFKNLFGFITLTLIFILFLSNLPIRKGYILYKLSNTQYETLVWLDYNFNHGKLKKKNYNFIVIGPSSVLYGFNDSLDNAVTMNLGVNTGCRAMELYLLERFIKSGNKTKLIIKSFYNLNAKQFDYYGLHPMLHYFVSPIWLYQHDQAIIQPHMLEFILKRCRVVFQSWFYFHTKADYTPQYTNFGYRMKSGEISESSYIKSISEEPSTDTGNFSSIKSWYHNYQSQRSFRLQTDRLAEEHSMSINYLYFPTLNLLTAQKKENGNLNDKIIALQKSTGLDLNEMNLGTDFFHNLSNWSDPGHYTIHGSRKFSDTLVRYYLNLK